MSTMRAKLVAIIFVLVTSGRFQELRDFLTAFLAASDTPDDAEDLKKLTAALKVRDDQLAAATAANQK